MLLDLTKKVKLANPEEGEESLVFNVVNYNEITERCIIELECDWTIKPQEIVSINDIVNI